MAKFVVEIRRRITEAVTVEVEAEDRIGAMALAKKTAALDSAREWTVDRRAPWCVISVEKEGEA